MKNLFLIGFLCVNTFMFSQVKFTAKASKEVLALNERFRITYSVNAQEADNFTPPKYDDFRTSGFMQGSNFSNINGKRSFEQTYSLTLQPTAKGAFTIPPATITYKGKTISSNTLKIKVGDKIVKPKDPNDPVPLAKQNIFLVTEVSNTNPFVGESIHVVYKIYVDNTKAAIRNEAQKTAPTYNGFWNQAIEIKKLNEKRGKYKDKDMVYYVIRKDVLIPQRAGNLKLTPLELDVAAVVATDKTDFFGRRLQSQTRIDLKSATRTIKVKALPTQGKPLDFNGAVGNFDFKVITSKKTINANESGQIKVRVSGNGNLKLVSLPKIETPQGIEVYDPEHKEGIKTNLSGMKGYIQDAYTIVPQYKGKYKIPALSFSYFNPKTKKYITKTSKDIIIDTPTGEIPKNDSDKSITSTENTVIQANGLLPIFTKTSFSKINSKTDFFKSIWFYLGLIIPFLIIPIGIFILNKKEERENDVAGNKVRKANRLAKKYLASAKKEIGNKETFYTGLEKALHNYLKAKLKVETTEISKDKITNLLKNKNVEEQYILQFIKVLEDSDFARFTPSSNLKMEQAYQNAAQVITNLDKQL